MKNKTVEKNKEGKVSKKKVDIKGKKEKNEKKKGAGIFVTVGVIAGIVLVLIGVGGFFLYKALSSVSETVESISVSPETREFSGNFKDYLINRLRYENLITSEFRELSSEEILGELSELKDGFSVVSRSVGTNYKGTEFEEIAEIIVSDSTNFLKTIRELRAVLTNSGLNEADKQLQFMKVIEGSEEGLRSKVYLSRGAYEEGKSSMIKDGIFVFKGDVVVETGGGVMNVMVGDFEKGLTEFTTEDLAETIKTIDAKKMFGYVDNRLVRIGEGVREKMMIGKMVEIDVKIVESGAEVRTRVVPLLTKGTWELEEAEGIKLIDKTETGEALRETIRKLCPSCLR